MSSPLTNRRELCIVGVGAATPVGMSAPASAAAVRAGIAMFVEHPYMIDQDGEPIIVAAAPYLNDDCTCEERFKELALLAAREALVPLQELPTRARSIPAIVGLPSPRPGLPELDPNLSMHLVEGCQQVGQKLAPRLLGRGHSAGLMAMESGWREVQNGAADFCLVGGVDCYLDVDTLEWIEDCDQLHKTSNAWGFVPGEAAGFCLICARETAERCKLTILGRLIAINTAIEENRIKTETICVGQGLSQAVRKVLESVSLDGPVIDYTICDQNGEAYRADEFGFMLSRTSERFVDGSDFLAPADCWGDVGAASGPLFVALAAAAARKAYAKGPLTLIWTSSEEGERSAAILHADVETVGLS